jgi:hypothetical protein
MRKSLYIISALFVISCQSYGAGREESFLDGLDSQVSAETYVFYVAPFSRDFIGKQNTSRPFMPMSIGEAATGLAMIDAGEVEEEHRPLLAADLSDCIKRLKEPKTFPVTISGVLETRSWHAHTVSPTDIKIAKALYGLVIKDTWTGYYQIERAVWNVLPGILGLSKVLTEVDNQSLAAMDLWVFLTAMAVRVWPSNPLPPRLSKPPYASGAEPCKDMVFLASTFKGLIEAYEMVKFAS